jgi:hypothetical protein
MNKEEVRKLREQFAQVTIMHDGSDLINRWHERVVREFGIIATHIEPTFTNENPLTVMNLGEGDHDFYVNFADRIGTVVYRVNGKVRYAEITHDEDRGKNTLPVALIVPVMRALPAILESAMRQSESMHSFFRICVEAVELDETSRQAEAEEPRPKFYILSKRDMSTTPYTLNQLGIVVAESIEEAAAKVGGTIVDRVDRPESAANWALLDDGRDLTEIEDVPSK